MSRSSRRAVAAIAVLGIRKAEPPAPGAGVTADPFDALRVARLADNPQHHATVRLDEAGLTRIADQLRIPEQAVLSTMMRDGAAVA